MKGKILIVGWLAFAFVITLRSAEVRLAWDDSRDEDGYRIHRRAASGSFISFATLPANSTVFSDRAVSPGVTYSYFLTAFNSAGESEPSDTVSATVRSDGITPVTFIGADSSTGGNWKGKYGTQGYNIIHDAVRYPSGANVVVGGNSAWRWDGAPAQTRALLRASSTARIAACWYNGSSFAARLSFNDALTHRLTMYFLDWDNLGRKQTVEILDANSGRVLTSHLVENFQNGKYLTWDLNAAVSVRITAQHGNAVLSGMFFDAPGTSSAPASSEQTAPALSTTPTTASTPPAFRFNGLNTTRRGDWKGSIGSHGYVIPRSGQLLPQYSAPSPAGKADWTWAYKISDTRALQQVNGDSRLASCWYAADSFQVELAFKDTAAHRISFYFLDWDRTGREQKIEVIDKKTGTRLHSYVLKSFADGVYLDYNLSGTVILRVSRLKNSNAVLSGIFFDAAQ